MAENIYGRIDTFKKKLNEELDQVDSVQEQTGVYQGYAEVLRGEGERICVRANRTTVLHLARDCFNLSQATFSGKHMHYDSASIIDISQTGLVIGYYSESESDTLLEEPPQSFLGQISTEKKEINATSAPLDNTPKIHGPSTIDGCVTLSETLDEITLFADNRSLLAIAERLLELSEDGKIGAHFTIWTEDETSISSLMFLRIDQPWHGFPYSAPLSTVCYNRAYTLIQYNGQLFKGDGHRWLGTKIKELEGKLSVVLPWGLRTFLLEYGTLPLNGATIGLCTDGEFFLETGVIDRAHVNGSLPNSQQRLLPLIELGGKCYVCLDFENLNSDKEPKVVLFESAAEAGEYTYDVLSNSFGEYFLSEVELRLQASV